MPAKAVLFRAKAVLFLFFSPYVKQILLFIGKQKEVYYCNDNYSFVNVRNWKYEWTNDIFNPYFCLLTGSQHMHVSCLFLYYFCRTPLFQWLERDTACSITWPCHVKFVHERMHNPICLTWHDFTFWVQAEYNFTLLLKSREILPFNFFALASYKHKIG